MAIIQNKKARFDYEIEEKFEAGLELRGWEVKSIRAGGASIKEAHVFVRNGELFLLNVPMKKRIPRVTVSSFFISMKSCD